MDKTVVRGMVAGAAAGMVVSWALSRFYSLAKKSSVERSTLPYLVGVGVGAGYASWVLRGDAPMLARVPLGAAVWLGEPNRTAAPPSGGKDLSDKARNAALRMAATGLKKVAEKALFA